MINNNFINILKKPKDSRYDFYQCINYSCYEITTMYYVALYKSRLLYVPKYIPKILHKPYLYLCIFKNHYKL